MAQSESGTNERPRRGAACALQRHLVLQTATAPAISPLMTVNPPDGLQPASPNLAILQQKGLRIHAIADSRTPPNRPEELTTYTQEFDQPEGECPATDPVVRNHPLVTPLADYSPE